LQLLLQGDGEQNLFGKISKFHQTLLN
jgi:hypothetical protein